MPFPKGNLPWNKGTKGLQVSYRKGIKGWLKHSEETKRRMSLKMKGRSTEWLTGRKVNENQRKALLAHCKGEQNTRWVVDRSKLKRFSKQGERRSSAYNDWRRRVWLRDNFKCKIANPDCAGKIEAHHILGWADYEELRYQINNGITLCHAHHPRKRAEEKRLSPYFQGLVSASN